jgi:crotonobetainyl-CoA:carnitine CoA-transferase CaiB-like acyl-CoA transferase
VKRLVAWADLVTENFTPGTLEEWGLGYEELCRVKPDVILFSTSMLGRGGPYSQQPGFGPVLASLSGMTGLTGWPDRMPTNPYGAYTDFLVPRFAVPAILAALDYRRRTGQGQHLDLSQLETSLHFMAPLLLDRAITGRDPGRMGNRHPAAAPHGAYPCRGEDRWCTIACHSDVDWEALCRVMGYPAWTQEERFATLLERKSHEDELDALVGQWTRAWEAYDLMQRLQQAGVPAGVVQTSRDLFEDPQLQHRGHFVLLDHPEMGRHPVQRSEFRLSRAQAQFRSPAPLLGQHTAQVCKEILRMSDEDIAALSEAGVLE